jgi:hypothetical protein
MRIVGKLVLSILLLLVAGITVFTLWVLVILHFGPLSKLVAAIVALLCLWGLRAIWRHRDISISTLSRIPIANGQLSTTESDSDEYYERTESGEVVRRRRGDQVPPV